MNMNMKEYFPNFVAVGFYYLFIVSCINKVCKVVKRRCL